MGQKKPRHLEESLEQVKRNVARVEVYGTPEGAVVTVNGKAIGTYPLPSAAVVNAGNLDIEVSKSGFKPAHRAMTIPGGHYERVLIRLDPLELQNLSPATSAPPGSDSRDAQTALGMSAEARESPPLLQRPAFWVVVGSTIVAAGLITFLLVRGDEGQMRPVADDRGTFQP